MGDSDEMIERLQSELDEYPTFMDCMDMQERLGPLADFLDALGYDHDAELVRRMLFPGGTVAQLRAEVERLRGELVELGGKLPSDRREALVATYAYEAGMEDARGELAARSDTEPTVCPTCGSINVPLTGRWWRSDDGQLLDQAGPCPDAFHRSGPVGSGGQ